MTTASLFQDLDFDKNKPLMKVLLETPFSKEIRIAMHKDTHMRAHKSRYPIVVQIVEGSIIFSVENNPISMKKGDLIALEGNVPHDLKAQENSIVRLTLTKSDDAKRIENVINC